MRHMCSWSKTSSRPAIASFFGSLLSWQTIQVHYTHVRTVFVTGAQIAETCSAQGGLRDPMPPATSRRTPSRVFGEYVPCGACTALVHRDFLRGLTPEETHHTQEELRPFNELRQMERNRLADMYREKTLGQNLPEEPVHADSGRAAQVQRKPAKSKLSDLDAREPVSLSPRTGSRQHGKQKQKPRSRTGHNHKVSKKPAKAQLKKNRPSR